MTIQQQDAIWPKVQKIWILHSFCVQCRDLDRTTAGVLAELLAISPRRVIRGGLERRQRREAFFARLAQIHKVKGESRSFSQSQDGTSARGSAQPKSGAAGRLGEK